MKDTILPLPPHPPQSNQDRNRTQDNPHTLPSTTLRLIRRHNGHMTLTTSPTQLFQSNQERNTTTPIPPPPPPPTLRLIRRGGCKGHRTLSTSPLTVQSDQDRNRTQDNPHTLSSTPLRKADTKDTIYLPPQPFQPNLDRKVDTGQPLNS